MGVSFRVGEAIRAAGTLRKLWKNGGLAVEAKKLLYDGKLYPRHYVGQKCGT